MKLTCDACKLTLNARDEDRGKSFSCPICRGPLREADGAARPPEERKPATPALEWSGGTLDDLLYMVNSQALASVVEVFAPDKKGEVHVIAGGVDEAYAGGERGDDAMATLRKATPARFRVELRLPSDAGSLLTPNADRGDLKTRPLARLMRYCEEYVLTCDLEAWRATETCRVEYRRGNIARTLINGIDAPEQLAEVMGWTSGNFRFVLPRLALPAELDQASRAQAKAAADARISEQRAARKTMFGMPAFAAAAVGAGAGASAGAGAPGGPSAPPPAMQKTMLGMPSAAPTPAPASAAASGNPAKTMLGMPQVAPSPGAVAASGAPAAPTVVIDQAYAAASTPSAPRDTPAPTDGRAAAIEARAAAARSAAAALEDTAAAPQGGPPMPEAQPQPLPPAPQPPRKAAASDRATPREGTPSPKEKQAEARPTQKRKPEEKRRPDKAAATARKAAQAAERSASPWVNVAIVVTVAAGIVLIWLLFTLTK